MHCSACKAAAHARAATAATPLHQPTWAAGCSMRGPKGLTSGVAQPPSPSTCSHENMWSVKRVPNLRPCDNTDGGEGEARGVVVVHSRLQGGGGGSEWSRFLQHQAAAGACRSPAPCRPPPAHLEVGGQLVHVGAAFDRQVPGAEGVNDGITAPAAVASMLQAHGAAVLAGGRRRRRRLAAAAAGSGGGRATSKLTGARSVSSWFGWAAAD